MPGPDYDAANHLLNVIIVIPCRQLFHALGVVLGWESMMQHRNRSPLGVCDPTSAGLERIRHRESWNSFKKRGEGSRSKPIAPLPLQLHS